MLLLTTNWSLFIGHFHPLVVHLPIGFLLLAAILEWWPERRLAEAARLTWWTGGVSAAVAVLCGWLLATEGGYSDDLLAWHRWLGVATMVLGLGGGYVHRRFPRQVKWYGVATLALVTVTGHLGGSLTHGEHYLWRYAPPLVQRLVGAEVTVDSVATDYSLIDPDSVEIYAAFIRPVLDRKCIHCHNNDKQSGGLRLDSTHYLLQGGDSGPLLIAGQALESEWMQRVTLPRRHRKAMPPKGEPLTYAEIRLLAWWINQGAKPDARVGNTPVPLDVQALLLRDFKLDTRERPYVERLRLPTMDSATLTSLAGAGWLARRLAQNSQALEVSAIGDKDPDLTALEPLAGHVVWLDLSGRTVDDEDLITVGAFSNLVRLRLQQTQVTDAGIGQLTGLQHLESLNLYGTAVTDETLRQLESLPGLRQLYLWQTKATDVGIEALRTRRPEIEVDTGFRFAQGPEIPEE